jgi:O-succinylbenzoic acid--CoA ligase
VDRLVALDLPNGTALRDALERAWDAGDAVLPLDQRLPAGARAALARDAGASAVVDAGGAERSLRDGRAVDAGDALVVATSGSTGASRLVVHTHATLAAAVAASHAVVPSGPTDHWYGCLPCSHVGGLNVLLRARAAGARLTLAAHAEPTEIDAAARAGATHVSLVPTLAGRVDLARWRAVLVGGAAAPAQYPSHVVRTYGLTESCGGVVYDGAALPGVEVRVADGEVLLRGPMVAPRLRDGTPVARADGWLATGDLGEWHDGHLRVLGRRDDLIVTGGNNVWPDAVERAIADHPAVAEVAVTGTPDPEWGAVVTAWVVPAGAAPTLDELRAHAACTLPTYAVPRRLEVVAEIPRTALGKPRRAALAARGDA